MNPKDTKKAVGASGSRSFQGRVMHKGPLELLHG